MLRDTELRAAVLVPIILLVCAGCGGGQGTIATPQQDTGMQQSVGGWPAGLPLDAVQPWESVDADGHVVPAERTASCLNPDSEFCCGAERQQSSLSGVTDLGEACRLTSGDAGSGDVTWAYWRLSMGGVQPGAVSTDVNLLPMSDGAQSEYYLGLSDYGAGQWQWHGPLCESHLRLSTAEYIAAGSDYLSEYGNLFVCIAACNGATFDVVGVAANSRDDSDTEPPPAPTGLTATPIAGGLELAWHGVVAGDLAGYRLYWRDDWFFDQQATGLKSLGWLEGHSRHMLPLSTDAAVHLRVSAIDISGNESDLSELMVATPLMGDAPPLQLTASAPSGMLGDAITLTATGADNYDWDLDGDGDYEVTEDTSGTQAADTSATGLIRPAVRGSLGDEGCTACGSVTLLVAGNTRPVATAWASPASGQAPLSVTFTGGGDDPDGEIENYAWDFDGDGTYDYNSDTQPNPPVQVYDNAGLYNAKLRVTDDQDAWDVDTVSVQVLPAPDPANVPPVADLTATPDSGDAPLTVSFDASGSSDGDGTIVEYAWDWDGDGGYDQITDAAVFSHTFTDAGSPEVKLRVTDDDWARATDTITITVNVAGNELPTADIDADVESGDAPLVVGFDAGGSTDPDGSVVRYDWDFDGDGNYELYDGGDNPADYTYTEHGSHTARLRVTDDAGAQATDSISIEVNGTPVADLKMDEVATAGEPLLLSATASSDPDGTIEDYEWDFDGDDVFNEAGNNENLARGSAIAIITPSVIGWSTVAVRVIDDDAATDTDYASFVVHGWVLTLVDDPGNVGMHTSLAVVDGHPAISYYDSTNGDLKYARSTTPYGDDPADWQSITVDGTDSVGEYTSLAVVAGCPAISYYDATNQDLKYARATTSTGSSASDWTQILTVDSTGDAGKYSSLAVCLGVPAICYHRDDTVELKYANASTSTGGAAGDWSTQVVTTFSNEMYPSLAALNSGLAAISMYAGGGSTRLWYFHSTSGHFNGASGTEVDNVGDTGQHSSLAIVNAHPAISYYNVTDTKLMYIRASGAVGGNWPPDPGITVDDSAAVGTYTSLAVCADRPAISYYDATNSDLKVARSSTTTGSSAADWQTETVDSSGNVGQYTSLALVNGCLALSYYRADNKNLKYAILF